MNDMRVWRVAHESLTYEGFPVGPYQCDGLSKESSETIHRMSNIHSSDGAHPVPHWDSRLDGISHEERCGFDSREALFRWFEGFTEQLHEYGFVIYVYEITDELVRVGEYGQAVFAAWDAKPVHASLLV